MPKKSQRRRREPMELKPFQCPFCPWSFRWNAPLIMHIRTHTGEKPFECDQCDKKFNRKDSLNGHLKTHAKTTNVIETMAFRCDVCDLTVDDADFMRKHIEAHALGGDEVLSSPFGASTAKLLTVANKRTRALRTRGRRAKRKTPVTRKNGKMMMREGNVRSCALEVLPTWPRYGDAAEVATICNDHSSADLNGFSEEVPGVSNIKVFLCDECDSAFAYLDALKDHVQICHEGGTVSIL